LDLKQKIIRESLKLFSLKGYLNTSIEDILERANSSKGGLYNHFKSKDELFLTVLSEARKIWREKVLYGLDEVQEPKAKVKKILENYRDRYLGECDDIPGGCVFVTLSVELDDQRPEFAEQIAEGFSRTLNMMKRFLDQAKESGELVEGTDTEVASHVLFNGMLGASVLYGTYKSSETLERSIGALIRYLDSLGAK